jgi:uncharacterized RDD family membrane protein YckC
METPLDPHLDTPADPMVHPKADTAKRAVAYLIDALLAGILGALGGLFLSSVGGLLGAAYMLLRDGLEVEFMDRRSIGKRLLSLRPVRLDGQPMNLEASLRRNWMFALGSLAYGFFWLGLGKLISLAGVLIIFYEIYRVLTTADGRRWGDELAGTQVVNAAG